MLLEARAPLANDTLKFKPCHGIPESGSYPLTANIRTGVSNYVAKFYQEGALIA